MPDEKPPHTGETPNASTPNAAPPLRDAEANRQIGEGKTPQTTTGLPDARQPQDASPPREPDVGAPEAAERRHTAEIDASKDPNVAPGHAAQTEPYRIGGRDMPAPSEVAGKPDSDKNLYERLAEKDVTPTEESGSGLT